MKHTALFAAPLFLAGVVTADCVTAWPSGTFANNTWGGSYVNSHPAFAYEREVADDFDFVGRVTRIYVNGFNGGPTGSPTPIDGVWVRFYAWTASGPGALQAAYFVAGNDPRVGVEPRPSGVDVELPTPFVASGLHFVSVQLDFTTYGSWDPWQCNFNAPRLSTGWVRPNNSNGTPWALYTPPFSPTLFADVDFVLYTDAAAQCSEWAESTVPTPGNDAFLVDVEVLAVDDVWTLGNNSNTAGQALNSYPFALHHDGAGWSIVDLPPAPPLGTFGSRTTMEALEAIGPDDIWAAGAHVVVVPGGWVGHQIRADHWDGTAWTTTATPLPPTNTGAGYSGSRITDIKGFASNDVWFVGEWVGPYPGTGSVKPALAMHWDGTSFALLPTPGVQPNGEQGLDAVDGVTPNDIWAVGGGADGDLSSYPYILHWNGTSWSHVASPLVGMQQRLNDVIAFASDDVWVVGEAFDGSGYVGVLQHWDGSSWSNAAPPPGSYPAAFHGTGPNDLRLGLWRWDGSSWELENVAGCDPLARVGRGDGVAGRMVLVGSEELPGRLPYVIERVSDCTATAYCSGKPNSLGCTPAIEASGTPSATATSGFLVRCVNLRNRKAGILLYGNSGRANTPFSGGTLCLNGPLRRVQGLDSGGTPLPTADCSGVFAVDMNAFRAGVLGGNPAGFLSLPGTVVQCQFWGRDPGFSAPNNTQLSNALEYVVEG